MTCLFRNILKMKMAACYGFSPCRRSASRSPGYRVFRPRPSE